MRFCKNLRFCLPSLKYGEVPNPCKQVLLYYIYALAAINCGRDYHRFAAYFQ